MKRFELDRDMLMAPAKRLLLIAGVVSLFAGLSAWYSGTQHERLARERADLNVLRAEYRDAVEAGGILRTSQQRYRDLEQRGFIGDEPRLLWIESLRNSGQSQRLYNLKYNLNQQRPVTLSDGPQTSHYQLFASPMKLHLDLAHEGRLIGFFENLRRERPAVYQLHDCTVAPTFGNQDVNFGKPNIAADCELVWFTARPIEHVEEDPM
ncbi:hypothetical protein DFR30_0080 [Thiogranum longum]|uniref:Uncharacterized protein n=1 Tax=Thiogranum longum TaxID=1537524 RepID=A0A4R1H8M7_9GAMM|nr:hypothetical protein [Thiogranum longum]TCK16861.1 hypothetical protein DFR30_0080 [Thiogranum longum]